jgi:hypothetical protein
MQAAILTGTAAAAVAGVMFASLVRQNRLIEEERSGWPFNVPWNSSWPSLPAVNAPSNGCTKKEVSTEERNGRKKGDEVVLSVDNMGVKWRNCYGEWDGGAGVGTTQERGVAKNKRAANS